MLKRFISITLVLMLFCGTTLYANAATITESVGRGTMLLEYGVDTSFVVTIPTTITTTLSSEPAPNQFSLTVSDVVIPYGTELKVKTTFDNELRLTEQTSVVLPYSLYLEQGAVDTELHSEDIALRVNAGTAEDTTVNFYGVVTSTPMYSGQYYGTVTFQVLVEDIVTLYSSEEIANNSHLFGIGKTQSDYVVAEFNNDYTSVTITKNGADSDGYMQDWTAVELSTSNPMYAHSATLTDITINSGVQNIGDNAFYNCSHTVGTLSLPNSVEEIGERSFYQNTHLTGLSLGNGVRVIGAKAFSNCSGLTGTIRLDGTTEFIDDKAFANATHITELVFGDNVGYIGTAAFQLCTGITSNLVFPDSLYVIGDFAFNHCERISNETLVIPEGVEHIGGTSYNKPVDWETDILASEHLGTVSAEGDYNTIAFSAGDPEYCADGYTVDNYRTATYADTATHVFYRMGEVGNHFTSVSVDADNTAFTAIDGVLYSADETRLVWYPTSASTTYTMVEGCVYADEMALYGIHNLTLADSYDILTYAQAPSTQLNYNNSLVAAMYKDLVISSVYVKPTNTKYQSLSGDIYSIDGTSLYHLSFATGTATIADGCQRIEGIFMDAYHYALHGILTFVLNIPSSVNYISDYDSSTYTSEGCLSMFNSAVDNASYDFTINVDSANTAYAVDGSGHINAL